MKSKLVILSLLMAGAALSAVAQTKDTKEKYFTEKAKDNIFISIGVGAQGLVNPDNFDNGFGHAITPLINVSVGKLFNPIWGIRGQLAGWKTKLNTDWGYYKEEMPSGALTPGHQLTALGGYAKYKKNYITANADALLNLTNLFAGYREGRNFEFILFGGPTLTAAKAFGSTSYADVLTGTSTTDGITSNIYEPYISFKQNKTRFLVGASVGLGAKYNVDKFWAIDLEARGGVSSSPFGVMSSANTDGTVALTAGVTYTFGGKKFVSCADQIQPEAINEGVNQYREQLAATQNQLAETKEALDNAKKTVEVKEVVKEVLIAAPVAVFFKIGKANISDEGMVNLLLTAKAIKANPSKKYKIAGYADNNTGSVQRNQTLTEQRVKVVYDALVNKYGVDADQLEVDAMGGKDNMFGMDKLNRVVILEVK